jgi:hypothetical protein
MQEISPSELSYTVGVDAVDQVDQTFVEDLWQNLEGKISQDQIRKIAIEIAEDFQDATITAYIPILLRRRVRDRLNRIISQNEEVALGSKFEHEDETG